MALATALANVLASSILFFKLTRSDGPLHIELHRIFKPDGQSARMIVRIGWPAGLQSSVFSLSNLIIQSAINSLGPEVMAASVAAFTIEINVYGFVNAFGLAATTFISQNYGAGNVDRCKRITWISMGLNIGFTLVLSILILVFGHTLLGVFTQSEDIIALGMIRLWWVVVPEPLNAVMEVFSDAMRGYGYSLAPAIITVIVICSVRVIWVYTAFAMKPTYEVLMMVYPLSWLITSIGLGILYFWFEKNRLPKLKAE
ncbi:MATE family efflux transporter [uncultured Parasutterella sp.]|uniref:MATE family efflux transporter n=1 Tax=uncultured Parasutterella sp. TaxID=1263098 RepID=UPI002729F61A|nr:MATE family efflux transporter [uncultured Parasutterella sp.]